MDDKLKKVEEFLKENFPDTDMCACPVREAHYLLRYLQDKA